MTGNLINNVEFSEVKAPVSAADNTDSNTDRIDMQGWDGVVFVTPITDSVDTGVATLTVEQNTSDSDSGMAALSGAVATKTSAQNDDLNGKLLIVDVYRPRERYVQGVLTSTTASIAFGNTIAIKYRGTKFPISQDSTVADSAAVVSPAES
jgi:hypothetical protein